MSAAKPWEPPAEDFIPKAWQPPEDELLKPEETSWSPPLADFAGDAEKDIDPDSLTARKAAGETLSMDQERILWKKKRARGLGGQTADIFMALPGLVPAAWEIGSQLAQGTATAATGLIEGGSALLAEGAMTGREGVWDSPSGAGMNPVNKPLTPEEQDRLADVRSATQPKIAEGYRMLRHIPIGAVNAGEDIIGIPVKAALGGSAITDKFKELPKPLQFVVNPLGALVSGPQQTEEQSFQNSLARQDFDVARAKDNAKNPDRAAIGMARLAESSDDIFNALPAPVQAAGAPLRNTVLQGADPKQFGKDVGQALREAALSDVDNNVVQIFDFFAPGIGEEQLLRLAHKPLQHVTDVAAKTTQKALLGVKAPEVIRNIQLPETVLGLKVPEVAKKFVSIDKVGLAPIVEKTGSGLLGLHMGLDKKVRQFSKLISGDENSLFRHLLDPLKPFTWVPGKGMQSAGRFFTDLGKTVDDAGRAGRKGYSERAARSAESAEGTRKFLGDGNYLRARVLDAASSATGYYAKRGIEGGITQMALGLGNIEDSKSAMDIFGSGFGLGMFSASMPHTFLPAMEEHRRVAENADILREMTIAGKETETGIETAVSPKVLSASYINQAKDLQAKIDASYAEAGNEAKRKDWLDQKLKHEASAAFWATISEDHPDITEAKRMAKLGFTDLATVMRPILKANGFGDTEIKVLTADQIVAYYRQIHAPKIAEAQAVLSDVNASAKDKADAATVIQDIETSIKDAQLTRGHAISEKSYPTGDSPIKGSVAILNVSHPDNLLSRPGNFEFALRHEVAHALEEYGEAVNLRDAAAPDLFATYLVDPITGEKTALNDGLYTDEMADADADEYLSRFTPEARARLEASAFNTPEKRRSYMRAERFAESMGLSAEAGQLLRRLNSPVQSAIDWLAAKSLNGQLGALRDSIVQSGKLPGLQTGKSTILNDIDAQSLAKTRNYLRALRDYQGRMLFHVNPANEVQIPILKILKSPNLQEKFKEIDLFVTDVAADIFDASGKKVGEVKILDPSFGSGGEYTVKGGQAVDADGIEAVLPLEVQKAIAALPGEAKVSIGTRIVRNPDGTPRLLTDRETRSRASARGLAIQNALDTAPDAKTIPTAMKDTGNGSYRGIMTPGQLAAIKALPELLVANSLKRKIFAFNNALARGDGTRFLINYQPVYRGGKARALSPKFRDVVPIGFQFTKDHNFLTTTASVSRMFDKLNYYSLKMPEKLNLWAGDQAAFIDDLARYLQNHASNVHGEGETSKPETLLASDIGTALEKKNILNDFLNMFDKETESANPNRTKIKAKKGQDSPDRIIMSARMDRITDIEESAAQKLPIKYDLVKRNFMPSSKVQEGWALDNDFASWADAEKFYGKAEARRQLNQDEDLFEIWESGQSTQPDPVKDLQSVLGKNWKEKLFGPAAILASVKAHPKTKESSRLSLEAKEPSAWLNKNGTFYNFEDADTHTHLDSLPYGAESVDTSDSAWRYLNQEGIPLYGPAFAAGLYRVRVNKAANELYVESDRALTVPAQKAIDRAAKEHGLTVKVEGVTPASKGPTLIQQVRAIPDNFTDTTPKFMPSSKVKDIPTAKLGELLAHFDADAEAGGLDYADWDGIAKFRSLYSRLTREEILDDLAMRMDLEDSILDNLTVK
ncbi:MAG: hypothetical protein M0Q93_05070, partial [Terrimicrobiaceae bacterium]|nr:hypothetical protein [Terrimicrobiaceae bacterium]